jgi:type VI secretion system protein ImpM
MTAEAPGFFGKIPARGDFLSRRVPQSVARPWDDWLGMFTLAVREAAGSEWPEAWLTAPLWRFTLGGSIAPPDGAAGVLVASVDRVGRMFPFTVIGPSAGVPAAQWFDTVETLVLRALDDAFDPDTLDTALIALGAPAEVTPIPASASLWSSRGSERVPPASWQITGLPDRVLAVAMVLGGNEDERAFTADA